MEKLTIERKYTTKSDNEEINFDYRVLDISKNKVIIEVLIDNTTLPFSNYSGIVALNYDVNSQFIRNSKEIL